MTVEGSPVYEDPIAGVMLIDKPVGPTSMRVCSLVRAKLVGAGAPKRIKVGHGGTLDPLASGLMVVLVGPATKLCDEVMAGEKGYLARIDLAHTSPTDDLESEPVPAEITEPVTSAQIESALQSFTGRVMQAPPAHSAMKVGGKRAYELARAGKLDRLEPRPVEIHELTVASYDWPMLDLEIRCGKGTYIRSLARDLGKALGAGGMLAGLRRTRVGRFTIDGARPMDDLPRTLVRADLTVIPEVERILDRRRRAQAPKRRDPPPPPAAPGD
jgi:tRNA pseudouridine55 synthase